MASNKLGETGKTLKEQHDELQGRPAKQAFRARWAEGQYNKYKESKTHQESKTIEKREDGTWYSLKRIAVEEGGAGPRGCEQRTTTASVA